MPTTDSRVAAGNGLVPPACRGTDAASEITRDLAPGSVEVRLRGLDPDFVVTPPPADRSLEETPESGSSGALAGAVEVAMGTTGPPAAPAPPQPDESGGTARITLRIPEHLKPRIDEAAGRMGLSVNAWLVRAVSAALEPRDQDLRPAPGAGRQFGRRYTGWVR